MLLGRSLGSIFASRRTRGSQPSRPATAFSRSTTRWRVYSWRRPITRRPPLAEVWHSSWDRRSDSPLDWWAAWGGIPVGGSDFHRPDSDGLPGEPTTWVEAEELSLGAIVDTLRAGRVAISAGPWGPVAARHEDGIVILGGAGATLVGPDGFRRPVRDERERLLAGRGGPHRLVDSGGLTLALVP